MIELLLLGNEAMAKQNLSLKKGFVDDDVRAISEYMSHALRGAADYGNQELISLLLEKGVDIDSRDNLGYTSLVNAVERGDEIIVSFLLEKGASRGIDVALCVAVRCNNAKMVDLLCDAKITCSDAYDALELAYKLHRDNIVKILLESIIVTPGDTSTPIEISYLDAEIYNIIKIVVRWGDMEEIKMLVNKLIVPEDKGRYFDKVIKEASKYDRKEIVKFLLDWGLSDSSIKLSFQAVFFVAVHTGDDQMLQYSLDKGADINEVYYPGSDGDMCISYDGTALVVASGYGYDKIVKILLDRGIDINKTETNMAALKCAVAEGHNQIVRLLLDAGVNIGEGKSKVLYFAVTKTKHHDVVATLLSKGFDPDVVGKDGLSLLEYASLNGRNETVEVLLKGGANVNQGTPLVYAAKKGHVEVIKILLKNGADVNQGDDFTALTIACQRGEEKAVQVLLDNGADVNKDTFGLTPFMIAREKGYVKIEKALLGKKPKFALAPDKTMLEAIKNYSDLPKKLQMITYLALISRDDRKDFKKELCTTIDKVMTVIADGTVNKWDKLNLCQEIIRLEPKNAISHLRKIDELCTDEYYDISMKLVKTSFHGLIYKEVEQIEKLWSCVKRFEPVLKKVCISSIVALGFTVDIAEELIKILHHGTLEKVSSGVTSEALMYGLKAQQIQEFKEQTSVIKEKCPELPEVKDKGYTFEILRKQFPYLLNLIQEGIKVEKSASRFLAAAENYLSQPNAVQISESYGKYEKLGELCKLKGVSTFVSDDL